MQRLKELWLCDKAQGFGSRMDQGFSLRIWLKDGSNSIEVQLVLAPEQTESQSGRSSNKVLHQSYTCMPWDATILVSKSVRVSSALVELKVIARLANHFISGRH